jgi:hypothetical protein
VGCIMIHGCERIAIRRYPLGVHRSSDPVGRVPGGSSSAGPSLCNGCIISSLVWKVKPTSV